ncbi:DNA methylase [Nostoc linckia z16]|jgi:adenine-specific DNA-methyltransferase|nr:DNA methylase [Nostoc linckia z15]PHK39286.1 DNA methylase [Nostoc linckia z16]
MGVAIDAKVDNDKLRGGYYTPKPIADFICRWAITSPDNRALEPSCGDGNFLEAAIERYLELGVAQNDLTGKIQGVELSEVEADKAQERISRYGLNGTTVVNSDFFRFVRQNDEARYDVVVGNPPFIRYQSFPEEHRNRAVTLMAEVGLIPNKLTNIWVPFLVISASLLNDTGRLGMVIPAELFQVKYAADTRVFLSKFFERITIVTFRKLVFDTIQQEVVLLLCEKKVSDRAGIRVVELDGLADLQAVDLEKLLDKPVKKIEHNTEKWTKYFLNETEIELLRRVKADDRIQTCGDYMDVDVGVVTGRNEFFMMNGEQVATWQVQPYLRPVVSKSPHLKGITFKPDDYTANEGSGYPVHLFLPPNQPFEDLPEACRQYIVYGEDKQYNTGYKCQIRKRWYITPSLKVPDGFALRQVNEFPKLALNEADALSTDTIHRVRFKPGVNGGVAVVSFLNSLTFAFSEILGRSYGGGVLTFEPTEVEELPMPFLVDSKIDLQEIDALMRQKKILEVLDIVDKALLIDQLGFSADEVTQFRAIWKKLSGRRIGRKR